VPDSQAKATEWDRIRDSLSRSVSEIPFTNWLEPLLFQRVDGGKLHLIAPNADVREQVLEEYRQAILDIAKDVAPNVTSIALDVEAEERQPDPVTASILTPYRHVGRLAAPDALWEPMQRGGGDMAFLHSFLAQIGLPRKRVLNPDGTDAMHYERHSGNGSLLVQAGVVSNGRRFVQQPIPYGPKPRLMLVDICTRAIQTRSPEVNMEASVRQYLTQRLDVGWGGGRNGQYTLFRRQALALSACSLVIAIERKRRMIQFQGPPIARFEAWVDNEGDQQPLWPGSLRLTGEFYESLIEHGMPIEWKAYQALSHSALAMDVYTFLAHRLWRIDGSVDLRWDRLRDAMAPEYKRAQEFRRYFLRALKAVQEVYPASKGRVVPVRGHLRLHQAKPPVPLRRRGHKNKH